MLLKTIIKSLLVYLIQLLFRFIKNVWGSIQTPYTTYRKLVNESTWQLLVIWGLIGGYFFFVSPIKLKTLHPLLLTVNTVKLFSVSFASYFLVCAFLLLLVYLVKGKLNISGTLLAWGYSMMPTLLWFLVTSLFFVILPPPRTESFLGRSFSILYLTFSLSLFFWKGILYYLTLRFALKLDLGKIFTVSAVFLPALFFYSLLLYYLGIFKVPFI